VEATIKARAAEAVAAAQPAVAVAAAAAVDPEDHATLLKDLSVFKKAKFAAQNPSLLMQRGRFAKTAAVFRRMPDVPPALVAKMTAGSASEAEQVATGKLLTAVVDLLKEAEVLIKGQSDDLVIADELGWAAVDEIRGVNLGLNEDVDELFQKKLAAKRKSDTSKAPDGQRRRQEGYGSWRGAGWGEAQQTQVQPQKEWRRWAPRDAGNREGDRRRR